MLLNNIKWAVENDKTFSYLDTHVLYVTINEVLLVPSAKHVIPLSKMTKLLFIRSIISDLGWVHIRVKYSCNYGVSTTTLLSHGPHFLSKSGPSLKFDF